MTSEVTVTQVTPTFALSLSALALLRVADRYASTLR